MTSDPLPTPSDDIGQPDERRKGPLSLYSVSVEYGLHTILWLLAEYPKRPSSRHPAGMQGIPAAMVAKIMPRLERAGIVNSSDGISGG